MNIEIFQKFIAEANKTHQQLCVWFSFNNQLAKQQDRWNKFYPNTKPFALKDFDKTKGAKYKNFWVVTLASTQHGWILGTARLFDPAFHPRDKQKSYPRISFEYILQNLTDKSLANILKKELDVHGLIIESIRLQRDNVLAHNDAIFNNKKIEAGIENLFEWLETAISRIKSSEPHLNNCGLINIEYNVELSRCGVEEVFSSILLSEKYENG